METEQWLEEAMLMINRSLRLIPDGYLRQSINSCREHDITLESVAGAGNRMGLIDEERITELKERIPEPANTRPRPDDVRIVRKTHQVEIESCRFLMNCMMGATRELPVIFDLQPTDEKDDENIRRILGDVAGRILAS
jgi:hypothetical protein